MDLLTREEYKALAAGTAQSHDGSNPVGMITE